MERLLSVCGCGVHAENHFTTREPLRQFSTNNDTLSRFFSACVRERGAEAAVTCVVREEIAMSPHDPLNFFEPYGDLPAHHENQLTRAFLVALRISPAAHQEWLSVAAPDRELYKLPKERRYDTQRWQMVDLPPESDEPIDGISVLQAADPQEVGGPVQITDRGQRYWTALYGMATSY
jgi:hypothetical protein